MLHLLPINLNRKHEEIIALFSVFYLNILHHNLGVRHNDINNDIR